MTFVQRWLEARRDRRNRARIAETTRQIHEKLAQLGGTASDIAATLTRLGITGYRGSSQSCPLANYLRREFGDAPSVSPYSATVDGVNVNLPAAAHRFVRSFDQGHFPGIITRPVER